MFIQFGYVVLFSSAFPLAALCALLNNIIEIRSDAFKLCTNLRRPFGERVENIGTWQVNLANRLNLLSMTGSQCTYCIVNAASSYKEHRLIGLIMFFPNQPQATKNPKLLCRRSYIFARVLIDYLNCAFLICQM